MAGVGGAIWRADTLARSLQVAFLCPTDAAVRGPTIRIPETLASVVACCNEGKGRRW